MSDLASLITALAALITSMGGAMAAVIVAMRSGNRQAQQANNNLDPKQAKAVFDLLKAIPGATPDESDDPDDDSSSSPPSDTPPPQASP